MWPTIGIGQRKKEHGDLRPFAGFAQERKLSQGDSEKCMGLLRCDISRAENGHTVPLVETLKKDGSGA